MRRRRKKSILLCKSVLRTVSGFKIEKVFLKMLHFIKRNSTKKNNQKNNCQKNYKYNRYKFYYLLVLLLDVLCFTFLRGDSSPPPPPSSPPSSFPIPTSLRLESIHATAL